MGKLRVGRMGPHKVVLKVVPELSNAYGVYQKNDSGGRRVLLSRKHNQNPLDFCDTVVHESVHVAADVFGLDDPEHLCNTLAAALVQFWVGIGLIDPIDWQKRLSEDKPSENHRARPRPRRKRQRNK